MKIIKINVKILLLIKFLFKEKNFFYFRIVNILKGIYLKGHLKKNLLYFILCGYIIIFFIYKLYKKKIIFIL